VDKYIKKEAGVGPYLKKSFTGVKSVELFSQGLLEDNGICKFLTWVLESWSVFVERDIHQVL